MKPPWIKIVGNVRGRNILNDTYFIYVHISYAIVRGFIKNNYYV